METLKKIPMKIIVLMTDFGTVDGYVAQMKGVLLQGVPEARIVDLTHEIPPYQIAVGSFLLGQTLPWYPEGTLFLAVVDPGVGSSRRPVALETGTGQFLVGPDNGLFTEALARAGLCRGVVLDPARVGIGTPPSSTFHGRDLFAPTVVQLARGKRLNELGGEGDGWALLDPAQTPAGREWKLRILHVDRFGNLILDAGCPERVMRKGRRGRLRSSMGEAWVRWIDHYQELAFREVGLLMGSQERLELAVNQGSAAAELGLGWGDPVEIVWEETA